MKNKLIEPAMLAGLSLSGFLAWYVLYRAVTVPGSSVWGIPITVFFMLLVVFFMSAVLVRKEAYLKAALAASLLLSLVFAPTPLHLTLLIPAIGLVYYGAHNIRDSLYFSTRLSFFTSLMNGRSYVVYALIIVITSQYYALVSRSRGEINLPTFEISSGVTLSLGKLYGHINPKYSFFSSAREMSVDKFILQNHNQALTEEAAAAGQVLEQGRKHLSGLVGRQLNGSEPVAEVFSDFATRKINDYFSVGLSQSGKSSPIPLFLTCVLFLTLLPLAAVVGYAAIIFSVLLCGALLKKGVIKKRLKRVQAESLEIA